MSKARERRRDARRQQFSRDNVFKPKSKEEVLGEFETKTREAISAIDKIGQALEQAVELITDSKAPNRESELETLRDLFEETADIIYTWQQSLYDASKASEDGPEFKAQNNAIIESIYKLDPGMFSLIHGKEAENVRPFFEYQRKGSDSIEEQVKAAALHLNESINFVKSTFGNNPEFYKNP